MAHKQKDFYNKIAVLFLTNLGIIISIFARVSVIRVLLILISFFFFVVVLIITSEEKNCPRNDPLPQQVPDLVIRRQQRFHVLVHLVFIFNDGWIEEVEEGICGNFLGDSSHCALVLVFLLLLNRLHCQVLSLLPVYRASSGGLDLGSFVGERVVLFWFGLEQVFLCENFVSEIIVLGKMELQFEIHFRSIGSGNIHFDVFQHFKKRLVVLLHHFLEDGAAFEDGQPERRDSGNVLVKFHLINFFSDFVNLFVFCIFFFVFSFALPNALVVRRLVPSRDYFLSFCMCRLEQFVVFVLQCMNIFVKLALQITRCFLQILQCFDASLYFLGQCFNIS